MSAFQKELRKNRNDPSGRRWIYVPFDQLHDEIGPLGETPPSEAGIVLVESRWWLSRRPYHRQKLGFILANMRNFALEQARRGVAVLYRQTAKSIRGELEEIIGETGSLVVMEPAERELRKELEPLIEKGHMHSVPHEGWITTRAEFEKSAGKSPPWRMDSFYRRVRQETGLLMEDGNPAGGKYSHDPDNRLAWRGKPPAPDPPAFRMDAIKKEIQEEIESVYTDHPGQLDLRAIPAKKSEAERFWNWAKSHVMEEFGPYEDAMSTQSRGLFHTRLSPLINIHRLLPKRILLEAAELDIPLNSKEGFIRQVIGWREFMKHVHDATDGFRKLPDQKAGIAREPGDGGYERWAGKRWPGGQTLIGIDGGSTASWLGAGEPLPPAFWGTPSGMHCLDTVVESVWEEGWSHHITRLMILSNIASLLDVSPREITDWFWAAYSDAYDWVVEPNVMGMGTFALGPLFTTKPYVSGSSYINKMSDYCKECRFSPAGNCPIKRLYWAYLDRHYDSLKDNIRMRMILRTLEKRSASDKEKDRDVFETTSEKLLAGEELRPEHFSAK